MSLPSRPSVLPSALALVLLASPTFSHGAIFRPPPRIDAGDVARGHATPPVRGVLGATSARDVTVRWEEEAPGRARFETTWHVET